MQKRKADWRQIKQRNRAASLQENYARAEQIRQSFQSLRAASQKSKQLLPQQPYTDSHEEQELTDKTQALAGLAFDEAHRLNRLAGVDQHMRRVENLIS